MTEREAFERAVPVPEGLAETLSRLANGLENLKRNSEDAYDRSYIGAMLKDVEALLIAAPTDPVEGGERADLTDCCCGETEQAWRLCRVHGPDVKRPAPPTEPEGMMTVTLTATIPARPTEVLLAPEGWQKEAREALEDGEPTDWYKVLRDLLYMNEAVEREERGHE